LNQPLFWIIFNLFVVAMLVLDLGVFHRSGHVVKVREAMLWSVAWIAMAVAFAVLVFFWHGRTPALEFVTGYVIELSLSVDNLFVFLLIFRFFKVSSEQQHRVLFWGIIGALWNQRSLRLPHPFCALAKKDGCWNRRRTVGTKISS